MPVSSFVHAERDRLRALAAYRVLDTEDEPAFTALVDSAASLLGTSHSAITLLDSNRQWRKASHGSALRQAPRAWSLCADVVQRGAPVVVNDLHLDPRHAGNPLGQGPQPIRCYAGVPLIGRDGLPLGDFSVSDPQPRVFTDQDVTVLTALATATVALLEQRRDDQEAGRSARPPLPMQADPSAFSPAGLRQALQRGEIEVHYQPIVSTPDGVITGAEASARWNMPSVGLIPPEVFRPFLESSPLLSQSFTEHVLDTACSDLAKWHASGADDLSMSVPVTGHDVTGGMLPSMVDTAVRRAGLSHESLTLRVTETPTQRQRDLTLSHVGRIRALGVQMALDDSDADHPRLKLAG